MTDDQEEQKHTPIPQPKETLLVGNLLDLDPDHSIESLVRISRLYGGIFKMKLKRLVGFVSSQELAHYMSNEDK